MLYIYTKITFDKDNKMNYTDVYAVVERIPYGKVVTYGHIARILGRPGGARQVGWAMARCPENLPWQRVVMSDGSVTGGEYAGLRKALLQSERVTFLPDGRVDMDSCCWDELVLHGRKCSENKA